MSQSGQGQTDARANMTVDFGFYTITLGDLVWNDADNERRPSMATEAGIPGVTVELWSSDGSTALSQIASQVTDASGGYTFSGLPAGNYIVRIPNPQFEGSGPLRDFRSSTGGNTEPAPDADTVLTNDDDNGEETGSILGLGGFIQSKVVTLTPAAEQSADSASGLTLEYRVDFGVYGGPQVDLAVTKDDGVELYRASTSLNYAITVTNNGPADVTGAVVTDTRSAQIASWTWTCAAGTPASYHCDGGSGSPFSDTIDLPFGASLTYNVVAQVSATASGVLDNTVTVAAPSTYTEISTTNNSDVDSDQPASLNVTKDDGLTVVAIGTRLPYHIVIQNNGNVTLTDPTVVDTLPPDVTFVGAFLGSTEIPPTTIVDNVLTWASADIPGLANLAAGKSVAIDVIVTVDAVPAEKSITNTVTVTDGPTGTTATATDTDNVVDAAKTLTGTSQAFTSGASLAIGEVASYSVSLAVKPGSISGLTLTDLLDRGLAFVDCQGIDTSSNAITTDRAGGFSAICAGPTVSSEPAGSSEPADTGRKIVFDFGALGNSGIADGMVTVRYRAIALDSAENLDGKKLANRAIWSGTGLRVDLTGPQVTIVEPKLKVTKTVENPDVVASLRTKFILTLEHTPESNTDAFNVTLSDVLPKGLSYVPGTLQWVSGTKPTKLVDSTAPSLRILYDSFPRLGEKSVITFQVNVGEELIGKKVTNIANVSWSSLPGEITNPQSRWSTISLPRTYNPTSKVDIYHTSSEVSFTVSPPEEPGTGFAPGKVAQLPAQPAEKAYKAQDGMWLEIPRLGIKQNITGVPLADGKWDLSWLSGQVGYLEGTAYPSQPGNSVLTGHVYDSNGMPGPFVNLEKLSWDDQVILHTNGNQYIYAVRQNKIISPRDTSPFKQEQYTWLTLLTCRGYDAAKDVYRERVAVKAVLIKVIAGQ